MILRTGFRSTIIPNAVSELLRLVRNCRIRLLLSTACLGSVTVLRYLREIAYLSGGMSSPQIVCTVGGRAGVGLGPLASGPAYLGLVSREWKSDRLRKNNLRPPF